jgi:hypothetical protein
MKGRNNLGGVDGMKILQKILRKTNPLLYFGKTRTA